MEIRVLKLAGSGRAHGFTTRKGFTQMDEFSSEESWVQKTSYKFFIWSKGKSYTLVMTSHLWNCSGTESFNLYIFHANITPGPFSIVLSMSLALATYFIRSLSFWLLYNLGVILTNPKVCVTLSHEVLSLRIHLGAL